MASCSLGAAALTVCLASLWLPVQAPADLNGGGPNGQTPGPMADVSWLFHAPEGIQKTLKWISKRYGG